MDAGQVVEPAAHQNVLSDTPFVALALFTFDDQTMFFILFFPSYYS